MNFNQKTVNIVFLISMLILLSLSIIGIVSKNSPIEHSDEFNRLLQLQENRDKEFKDYKSKIDSLEKIKQRNDVLLDSIFSNEKQHQKNIEKLSKEMSKIQMDIKTFKGRVNFQDSSKNSHKDFFKNF